MFNVTEALSRLRRPREPKPWTPEDWRSHFIYDGRLDDLYYWADSVLSDNQIAEEMGLAGDGKSSGLLHRYLTLKFLQTDQRCFAQSEGDRKSFGKVIEATETEIKEYTGKFFANDQGLAARIRLSVNLLYSLATDGNCHNWRELSKEKLTLWRAGYGKQTPQV